MNLPEPKHSRDDDSAADDVDRAMGDSQADADRLAATWFDDATNSLEAATARLARQDEQLDRRLADLQFLHVLLDELHNSSAAANSIRVEKAIATIRALGETDDLALAADTYRRPADAGDRAAPVSRRKWLISSAAIAAGLSGAALWLSSPGSRRTAHAAVQKIAQDARIPKDRQYRVTTEMNHARGEQGRIESLLYVRGGAKFALVHRGPLGDVWLGSNGQQSWLLPGFGPPIVNNRPSYPGGWSGNKSTALPDLQLTTLLDLMAERFELAMLPDEALPDRPEILCQRISGWCGTADSGPQRIELWSDLRTGVAQRLVLEWPRSPDETGLTRIQLELLSERPQSDAFYEVEAHRRQRRTPPPAPLLPEADSR